MEAKHVRTLMEAYASVYEGYGKKKKGDCVSKSEKGDHNCAKKVCHEEYGDCLLYTSPSPRDYAASRMPSSA